MKYDVTLRFQYPAHDEKDGICYPDIAAKGKQEANEIARRRAERDGHLFAVGKGRAYFKAVEAR